MFSAFIGHGPLYKSKRKNVGKLFTPVVTVAFVLLVAILLVCILAPVVAPYDPNAQDLTQVLAKPSAAHWLGCDQTGRDIFSRIIYGGRTALVSAVMVVVISVIIGIPLGLISGYKGGLADTIIMRCCDILLSFPSLLLAFVSGAEYVQRCAGLGHCLCPHAHAPDPVADLGGEKQGLCLGLCVPRVF